MCVNALRYFSEVWRVVRGVEFAESGRADVGEFEFSDEEVGDACLELGYGECGVEYVVKFEKYGLLVCFSLYVVRSGVHVRRG